MMMIIIIIIIIIIGRELGTVDLIVH
jgi:hypothetical protein